ncbi:MAG: hypothetical protein J0L80_01820 [Chitinophagales bacterium]|nr:hypothetical protein [Chitinophagales bacterium]
MSSGNPHLIKRASLFAMFCLSYLPLLVLLIIKVLLEKRDYLNYGGIKTETALIFIKQFGFVSVLGVLAVYAIIGTLLTLNNIKSNRGNGFPAKVNSIKPKNEEALSYLATYVLPLLVQGNIGLFEYITFTVLFGIYYKLYSTSSLILINPILNIRYGLYEIEYVKVGSTVVKSAMVISEHKWINEDDEIKLIRLSHRLYFAF